MDSKTIKNYFSANGLLSAKIPSFDFRPQQLEMADAVSRALDQERHLIVESGTGTGKSLAYLIPAIEWALANDKKVVISTYTKTLQEQIINHDIPLLRQQLNLPFRHALCLGHENYLSLRRMKRAGQGNLFNNPADEEQLTEIFDWSRTTANGLKSTLPFEPSPWVWEEVGRQKDLCMGKNCETFDSCFYYKERRKWFGAHILVVNHHLFFANVANSGAVLPRFDAVIFDEAQNLEEVATNFLGLEFSNSGLFYFLDRLHHPRTHKGTLSRFNDDAAAMAKKTVAEARRSVDRFFLNLFDQYGSMERSLRFYKPPLLENNLFTPFKRVYEELKTIEGKTGSEEESLEISAAAQRCFEFNNTISALLSQDMKDYVYWLEIAERKRFPRATLRGVPINLCQDLKEQVFGKISRVVLTSATLTTQKNFNYLKERIGIGPDEEKILDSPFDYSKQTLLYIPTDLPEPSEDVNRYSQAMAERIKQLLVISKGKAFILFTSYEMLNRVYGLLVSLSEKFQLLKQGDLSTSRMIQQFKEKPSVIFGTSSFWQGVDIPGEALSSVIITKLPFDVPTDPLIEARMEDLRKRSINPFEHFQIPRAIIQLRQGFGRLIRKKTDRGLVSILDSRMTRRGYGKKFLNSLPQCRVTEDIEETKIFFEDGKNGK